ncbi:phosphatidylglycerophosphate synthase [uncultured Campylobacter sp.]|uniref:helix-turn-helix domain-containing protein n=1 Tax=uncultured Campylobacter sp. TaxID=218934 RepID=UPI0025E7D16A|nr:phosphatidylglycerophosphate synthase [uncultured Campylobacter sp.]
MNDISLLKELGLSEVARRTHIEAEYLGYIADKNFEKLARFNVKGFVKILERELDIDFTSWMREYETFMAEHESELKHKTITISPKIPAYTASEKSSYGGMLGGIIAICAIGALIYFFEPQKYIGDLSSFFEDKNKSVTYSDTNVVQQATKNLDSIKDANITVSVSSSPSTKAQDELSNSEENVSNLAIPNAAQPLPEINVTVATVAQPKPIEQNTGQNLQPTEMSNKTEQNITATVSSTPKTGDIYELNGLSEIKVVPRKKVWLGVINLDDNKKRSLNASNPVTIEIGKKQLVVTGHGEVNLEIGEQNIKFSGDNPKRFLVEKDKVTPLSFDEFVALNKGKSW